MDRTLERLARDSLVGMTGGLIVVSIYFVVVYAFLSVGCVAGWDGIRLLGMDAVRFALVAITLATFASVVYFGWRGLRAARREMAGGLETVEHSRPHFTALISALLCVVALVTAAWVALPIFFLAPCP